MDQATLNIGIVGHVAHGKSTLTKAITGVQTQKHKKEKERNITIKLGYANAKIYYCLGCNKYSSQGSDGLAIMECLYCPRKSALVRHVSFVDVPGHSQLMGTMLNGVSIMDASILLIAANQPCPQPQTEEHLAALKNNRVIVVQNKVDVIPQDKCIDHYNQISNFISGSPISSCPIIPVSAQRLMNIDVVLEHIMKFPIPDRDSESPAQMMIVRSFDVNRPGATMHNLVGGVAGGSITRGTLRLGDSIQIRPGIMTAKNGVVSCQPIDTVVVSLLTEKTPLKIAVSGGLIGVGTEMDPSLCKDDRLVKCLAFEDLFHPCMI